VVVGLNNGPKKCLVNKRNQRHQNKYHICGNYKTMSAIIQVNGLSKLFGSVAAVNNISFEVKQGQVFGLLGPNGSGKTTTLSMMLTLLKPSSGNILLFGSNDLIRGLKRTGVLLESANYYPELSARSNMLISCKIKNVDKSKIEPALQQVDLQRDAGKKVKNFSLGMKQRLSLASALLSDPELLIFDEPTNGLDPHGIADTREIIKRLAKNGKTILIASNLLNEMEKVCTHIALLRNGTIIDQGELQLLTKGYESLEEYFLNKTR
jgi:ABC-type multidrug transport system ATPase subunit